MASLSVYDAIRSVLDPGVGGTWTATPISWPNETDPPFPPTDGSSWVAVELTGTLYGQQSFGESRQADNRWDEEGILWMHVFVQRGNGEREQRDYCKQLADKFRGLTLLSDSLEFGDAAIGMGEPSDAQGAWWRISISIEWRRIEA
jgi:hypothetical protein